MLKPYKNKEWLCQQYWNAKKSMLQIGDELGISGNKIWYWIKKFKIKARTYDEAGKLFHLKHPGFRKGKHTSKWKGGKTESGKGYILIYQPNHPNALNDRYVFEHRLVMEGKLGRHLTKDELIHHINGIRDDNRIENLVVENKKTHPRGYAGGYREGFKAGFNKALNKTIKLEE